MQGQVTGYLKSLELLRVSLADGTTVAVLNNSAYFVQLGDIVELLENNDKEYPQDKYKLKTQGLKKYLRALAVDDHRISFVIDSVSYATKKDFTKDLENNGYKVKSIDCVRYPIEFNQTAIQRGTYIRPS